MGTGPGVHTPDPRLMIQRASKDRFCARDTAKQPRAEPFPRAWRVLSQRRFRTVLPGPLSGSTKRVRWIALFGLCFTASSATAMYLLVFWL